MKTVKLKFVGFFESWNPADNFIINILRERYDVQLSENPDFVVCSVFGIPYEYTRYPVPRLMYCGENLTPDFSLVDYAIGHEDIRFYDRYFRYPSCIHAMGNNSPRLAIERNKYHAEPGFLEEKTLFCNFIHSHPSENAVRETFFQQLHEHYKPVASAGTFLNNMPDGHIVTQENKYNFQKKCKFSIAFESTRLRGFCTEKIMDAFVANTIPIYYGNPDIKEIFNPEAFIHFSDYADWREVMAVINELDEDDDKYMEMLGKPVFNDAKMPERKYAELKEFLFHIFEQNPEEAFRRSRVYASQWHNERLSAYAPPKESPIARGTDLLKRLKAKIVSNHGK